MTIDQLPEMHTRIPMPRRSCREKFEAFASDWFDMPLEKVQQSRMSDGSYRHPKLSTAWVFWSHGRV